MELSSDKSSQEFMIDSFGNGLFFELTRLADGESVFLQGDAADRLRAELERTHAGYTDDDAVSEYFS
jgi:hypothetical protein